MSIIAAYQSQCPACGGIVFEGDEIAQDGAGQWVCAECARPQPIQIPAQGGQDLGALLRALQAPTTEATGVQIRPVQTANGPAHEFRVPVRELPDQDEANASGLTLRAERPEPTDRPHGPCNRCRDPHPGTMWVQDWEGMWNWQCAAMAQATASERDQYLTTLEVSPESVSTPPVAPTWEPDDGPKDSVDAGEAQAVPHSTRIFRSVTLADGTQATAAVPSNPFVELADKVANEPAEVPGQMTIQDMDRQDRRTELVGPFPESATEAPAEEPPFDDGPPVTDLTDYADRLRTLREAQAEASEYERRAKLAKETADEIKAELEKLGITTDGEGHAVITVNGVPTFERKVTKGTRLAQAKWKERNPNWKTGRYAEEYETVRWVAIGG